MLRTCLLPAALFCSIALQAQTSIATNSPGGKPLSTRIVAYTIDARLDTDKKSLDATETITYKNVDFSLDALPSEEGSCLLSTSPELCRSRTV